MTFYNVKMTRSFIEHEREVFHFDQRGLYQNEPHGKLLKATKMAVSGVPSGVHFYVTLTTSTSIHQYRGFPTPTCHSLNIANHKKGMEQIPLLEHEFLRDFKNSISNKRKQTNQQLRGITTTCKMRIPCANLVVS